MKVFRINTGRPVTKSELVVGISDSLALILQSGLTLRESRAERK